MSQFKIILISSSTEGQLCLLMQYFFFFGLQVIRSAKVPKHDLHFNSNSFTINLTQFQPTYCQLCSCPSPFLILSKDKTDKLLLIRWKYLFLKITMVTSFHGVKYVLQIQEDLYFWHPTNRMKALPTEKTQIIWNSFISTLQ